MQWRSKPNRPGRTTPLPSAALALALLACPLPPAIAADAPLSGQHASVHAPPAAPDFSDVTTRTIAGKLVRKRQLVKIHFFPTELGGPNTKINTGYVTPEAAASHARLIEMLSAYVERGRLDHLEIVPDYKGLSIVPTRILIKATHSRGGDRFERVIEVWDCGLCPPLDPLPDPDGRGEVTA